MKKRDTVIIGAGPAGMATALAMQSLGYKCTVIDKEEFPRSKACGGLLTMKSISLLGILLDDTRNFYENSKMLKKVYVSSYGKKLFDYECDIPFFSTSRLFLDNELVMQYTEKDGDIIESCKCINVDQIKKVIITTRGELSYDKLVIANGADSKIPGLPQRILQTDVKRIVTPSCLGGTGNAKSDIFETDGIHISVGQIWQGYSWAFPQKDNSFNIGFAGNLRATESFPIVFSDILNTYGLSKKDILWGKIPIYQESLPIFDKNIFMVGSSTGMLDALTGEGLFFAFLSGIYTGLFLANHITYFEYQHGIKQIDFYVKGGMFSANILWKYKLLAPLLKLGSCLKKLDVNITDHLISNYNYNHYSALLSPIITYLNLNVPNEHLINRISELRLSHEKKQ